MLLTGDEIGRSTEGAWALFKGDARGLRAFDTSFEGFWRSFAVFALLIPVIGILIASERIALINHSALSNETFPAAAFLWSRLIGFAIGWVDYPLVLAALAGPFGLRSRYVPLIVALNWTSLVAAVPVVIPSLLHVLGIIGDDVKALLDLFALGVTLRYQYVVTRAATAAPPAFCAGLVVLDFVLGMALGLAIVSFAGI